MTRTWCVADHTGRERGGADLRKLLALAAPPTAVFASSDTQAIGVLAAADRCGVGVPGDLSVLGFDDIESAALLGLSTVHQPLWDSGAEAARRLCALLRGERAAR